MLIVIRSDPPNPHDPAASSILRLHDKQENILLGWIGTIQTSIHPTHTIMLTNNELSIADLLRYRRWIFL